MGRANAATANVNTTSKLTAAAGGIPNSLATWGSAMLKVLFTNGVTNDVRNIANTL